MSEGSLSGRCLCGAVRIEVAAHTPEVSACHCRMCQRWSGGVLLGFEAPAAAVTVAGPVRRYASSDFAERAWCDTCGSQLWFRENGAAYELSPGLFDAAAGFPMTCEVYADRAVAGLRFAGEHERVTRADYEAHHPFVEGDAE